MVRSNGEVRIDDWLSENKIEHIYEQKLPISHLLYCDWYLPKYNVYIEFWGSIHSIDEGAKRKYKEKVYKKNGFKLINLENDDLLNLNDRLNHELVKL
jgi:very-short-patch-repair endonuclease